MVTSAIAQQYLRFAEQEADGRSPLYAALARGVAADAFALAFLAGLPDDKRQPNLLLAALRHVAGVPADWAQARAALRGHAEAVRAAMLTHRTQTNEPGRCAALLPALAGLRQPLALLEVGASAGLCLLPDRYGYAYGARVLPAPDGDAPVFPCDANAATPLPERVPRVAWRAGLDLAPVDLQDAAQCQWLETLVWPEHTERLGRLRAAMLVARRDAPAVQQGDLLTDLSPLARCAPPDATLVIFHTAVLAYVRAQTARDRFVEDVRALGAVWISNEMPGVFPQIASRVRRPGPRGAFLLAVDGTPVAWTQPHGEWIQWLQPEDLVA